jgi:hypothetical protein
MFKNLPIREAIESPLFIHARQGKGLWRDIVYIYHKDSTSPSGKILAASGTSAEVDPILAEVKRTSALSPDER